MLYQDDIKHLSCSKNLLAFSGGSDSTALFFLLHKHGIKFDIAIVDYGTRDQSKAEVAYAKDLALSYRQKCFVHSSLKIEKNFEANARKVRYDFFNSLIKKHKYTTLITAHHLGDRLEWLLMQLCKGAGLAELNSLKSKTIKSDYTLLRPLLHVSKDELIQYLKDNHAKYFEDQSNADLAIKRNYFRHNFANPMLKQYSSGIKKSFQYLDTDTKLLIQEADIKITNGCYYFKKTNNYINDIYHVDKILKTAGILIGTKTREDIQKNQESVIAREYLVTKTSNHIFITPFVKDCVMSKNFKERCRQMRIPPKIRPVLYKYQDLFKIFEELSFSKRL